MKAVFLTVVLVFGMNAQAQQEPKPAAYSCEVMLAADGVKLDEAIWRFEVPARAGSHGGEPKNFAISGHTVSVMADGQWLGLSWSREGVKVAEAVFVIGSMDATQERVGILYDPANTENQVSAACSALR